MFFHTAFIDWNNFCVLVEGLGLIEMETTGAPLILYSSVTGLSFISHETAHRVDDLNSPQPKDSMQLVSEQP